MSKHETLTFNPEFRAKEDFATWAAEALNGQMRTPTEYEFSAEQNDLIAEDGSSARAIFTDAFKHAEELTKAHPQLAFELRRRGESCELGEFNDMVRMMKGELPNTMVVVSDFPSELMNYPKDVGGYNVDRKQTFLRVIFTDGNRIKMFSQTLDQSDRDGLESIYHELGFVPKPGELLGQRMHFESDEVQKQQLTNRLKRTYDETLEDKFGGKFEAGIRIPEQYQIINTYDFVHQQRDIIRFAVKQAMKGGLDKEKQYELMAVLAKRYEKAKQATVKTVDGPAKNKVTSGALAIDQSILLQEMALYGQEARMAGVTFTGCGATIESFELISAQAQLDSDGYGNKTSKEETYSFNAYQFCVSCQAPPKEKETPKWCGPCGLCRGCDKKAGGKG